MTPRPDSTVDGCGLPPEGRFADRIEWRLTEHFFRALFDFGLLSTAGADSFKHMLLGAVGGFLALGFLATYLYAGKYAMLWHTSSDVFQRAVLGDDLMLVGFPMLLVAFVTLLVSHSLFPDERDFRILGPLPVGKGLVFGAKLTALVLFSGLFTTVALLSLLPLLLLTSLNPFGQHAILSRLAVWTITGIGASMFAVLAVTAIVGLFVLVLSRTRLHELTGIFKSIMLGLLVVCLPLVLRLPHFGGSLASGSTWLAFVPPAWFVGLQQVLRGTDSPWFFMLARLAVLAMAIAAVVVGMTYVTLFRHFERLMLRSVSAPPSGADVSRVDLAKRASSTIAHAALIPAQSAPAFLGVYRFTILTLRRSQLHQGVLVGLSACGMALAVNGFVDANVVQWLDVGGPPSPSLAGAAIWTPFAVMFVCALGVRAALALPMEHRANWIFRLTEDEATRGDQMRAVDRVVTGCLVGVPVALAVPLLWMALGPKSVVADVVVALIGLIFVHAVLFDWRRIPFTCSYLPGKRFVAHTLVFGFAAYVLFPLTAITLLRTAIIGTTQAMMIVTALSALAYLLRRHRLTTWRETPLMFEDEFPDEPQLLQL